MTKNSKSEDPHKLLKQAISAFVSVTHVIAFFQIVICSRHLAVAFNIPAKNIGIYFAKLYSLRSLLMSLGCAIEYVIFRASNINIRRYSSIGWFVLLTICEVSFLCVLYFSKNVAYHNYIVLNLEGMFFGFFQMSILSLIPEFVPYYMVSLYVSGTGIFIIQTIIDKCTKNSMLSVKIQSWICVFCSIESVALWTYYLIYLFESNPQQTQPCNSQNNTATTQSSSVSSSSSGAEPSASGGGSGSPPAAPAPESTPEAKSAYVMSLTSMTILKIMTDKLDQLCSKLSSETAMNVQILIARLHQIRSESQITYDMLVAIDLVILALKKCQCSESQLCLLAELSLFLRMKVLIKPLEQNESTIQEISYAYGSIGVKDSKNGGKGEPVLVAAGRYMGLVKYVQGQSQKRLRRQAPEQPVRSSRTRRDTKNGCTNGVKKAEGSGTGPGFLHHLLRSLSPLMMFGTGSLVKDFLFPGVIPYGLLERDKCHLINLIVIIFLAIGPVTIFLINQFFDDFKKHVDYYHYFWLCMIPKIIILIISLCAIHTKQGCTHQIRSSRWRVFLMTMILLTCYGFLETMSFVGMGFYVKVIAGEPKPFDLLAIHNVSGKFFRYFVYKVSVGYNKTRIGSGFTLPNFKPPEPIPNTFCYWLKGAFVNGGKDIKGDFKMGIQQYLAVRQFPRNHQLRL